MHRRLAPTPNGHQGEVGAYESNQLDEDYKLVLSNLRHGCRDEAGVETKVAGAPYERRTLALRSAKSDEMKALLCEHSATLTLPEGGWHADGGRAGVHTEHLGHMLAEMQVLQRSHPGLTW